MRTSLLLALLCALPVLPAQRLIHGANVNEECREMTGVRDWFCLGTQAPANQGMLIIAVEFPIKVRTGPLEFALYDQDPSGLPGTQLATGQIPGSPYPIWQGGMLSQPVLILPGQPFFVGHKNLGGDLAIVQGGTNVPYHYLSGTTWRGPFATYAWGFRLYTGGGGGAYLAYGNPKNDPAGRVTLAGLGWPNTGNPIGLLTDGVPAGGVPLLLLGRQHPGVPAGPLGDLYVFPHVFVFAPTVNPQGYALLDLNIPNDPVLAGASVAWQTWVALPSASSGVLHTAGLRMNL